VTTRTASALARIQAALADLDRELAELDDVRLHPESVTEAWYAADCPQRFDARSAGVRLLDRLRWRVACLLRRCRR